MRHFTLTIVAACAVATLLASPLMAQRRGGGYGGGGGGRYYGGGHYYGGYYSYPHNYGYYGYGYRPYYYGGYYSYPNYSYYNPGTTYTYPDYAGNYYSGPSTSAYQPADAGDRVNIHVMLPDPTARLLIQDKEMQATGARRDFVSPPMERGRMYTYTFTATWMQNGQPMTRTKSVDFQPGQELMVNFNEVPNAMPPNSMPPTPAG